MNENIVLPSNMDIPYDRLNSEIKSVDIKKTFTCNALSVLKNFSVPKLLKIGFSGSVFNGSFGDTGSESSEMDCSDVSDISMTTFTSSVENNRCAVNCLEHYEDLRKRCELLGFKFVDCSEEKEYEVDFILKDKLKKGEKYYLVKWKNYDLNSNTWEPVYHLTGCHDLIYYYEALKSPDNTFNMKMFNCFVRDLTSRKPYDCLTLLKLLSVLTATSEDLINMRNYTTTYLRKKLKEFIDCSIHKIKCRKKDLLALMRYAEKRKHVLINLKEWEHEINSLNPATYIKVENNVDLEKAPTDFKFIHDYVYNSIEIDEEPTVFCSCDKCMTSKISCCPGISEAHFAYNKYKRLQLLPGYPIYECNKRCKCGDDCVNRVVQHGSKIKVAIFRTSNGCGWGLKALETIQKDQFVLEYLGEILTSDEAEIRGQKCDNIGRSYLFDLDFNECKYTVDAAHVGNSAHFINHSCEPNLHVFAVWINCQDPQLPRLAFFAKRKINRGEELTFDYKMFKNHCKDNFESSNAEGKVLCKCNARNCRKYLC